MSSITRDLAKHSLLCAVLAGGCFAAQTAAAVTVPIGSQRDTTIFENNKNNSAGGQTQVYSGANTAMSPRRGLVGFDIAGNIPAGSTITSVDLTLTLSMVAGSGMGGGGGSPSIELHEIAQNWGEGSVSTGSGQGAAAAAGDATWNSRLNGSALWDTAGGDYDPTASASLTIVGTTVDVSYTWSSTPSLVADVQQWLDNPASNFGWLLLNTSETGVQTFRAFYSREASTQSFRPSLAVTYQVPEPSTLVLFAAGSCLGLTLAARRRTRSGAAHPGETVREHRPYWFWDACSSIIAALTMVAWLASSSSYAADSALPTVTPQNAAQRLDRPAQLEMAVVEVKFAQRRKLHFLSATANFRADNNLPVAISDVNIARFRQAGIEDLSVHYLGQKIRARGTVIRDEGQWLLLIRGPDQIEIIDGPAPPEKAAISSQLVIVNEQGKQTVLAVPLAADLPRGKVSLEHDGKREMYEGVPLVALLERAGVVMGSEARGPLLGRYVVVRARDGYAVVFSLAEMDPYFAPQPGLLADRRNDANLPETRMPLQVVMPGDKHRRRWVGQVNRIEVRNALDKATADKP